MALSNEDLLKELSAKPIMEVVELVKMLEEEWGVSAAAPVAAAGPAAGGDAGEAADQRLAELPTFDQARAMLLGVMLAPMSTLVRTLAEPSAMLARTLGARGVADTA